MATKFYLIRHGESQANKNGVFIGHTDIDLTEKGHRQAQLTAEYLKDVTVDAIYSSDLCRAYHTAEHTAHLHQLPVIPSVQLREIYGGEWENRRFDDLERDYPETYGLWLSNIGRSVCDRGESVLDLQARLLNELGRIAAAHKDETVCIFTHATPVRALACAALGKTPDEMAAQPWPTNASVSVFEYDNGKLTLLSYSEDGFMDELRTALPDNV